jgi:excinuclease ABC subunit A
MEDSWYENGDDFLCPNCQSPLKQLGMADFSFNKPAGACPRCTGLGAVQIAKLNELINFDLSISQGAIQGWDSHTIERRMVTLATTAKHYHSEFDFDLAVKDFPQTQLDLLLYGVDSSEFKRHFQEIEPPEYAYRDILKEL